MLRVGTLSQYMDFVLGQRWVSQTETELGLGMVVDVDGRFVTLQFPAAEEERVYAVNNSPLARVIYEVGETVHDQEQLPYQVVSVEDLDGLHCYLVEDASGKERMLPETQISGLVLLTSPNQRLLSGQFDKPAEYQLRVASLEARYNLQRSQVRGLLGSRTSLLPHQIYIAYEVATRFAPRVLLADEVGLGKTIEAGMILHHQLQSGLASRVLIVVPDALVHQWLVEMLRKFGLHFSIFNQERYDALLEGGEDNPFEAEQLVLASLSLLTDNDQVLAHATEATWDLLIVDEAHHLVDPSPAYSAVSQLAGVCTGLLLLTATPEQLGASSHFSRLRLLDPARFSDFERFTAEQARYAELNDVVQQLAAGAELSSDEQERLADFAAVDPATSNEALIQRLLDQHGTGRVLFRNTRAAVTGFPQRRVSGYPLAQTDTLKALGRLSIAPEAQLKEAGFDWLREDPRVYWLEKFLLAHRLDKVLLICASAETATDLEKHLHLNVGIRSAAFYEGLSIIERDRAAAYFAEEDVGAQVLLCSEIGSEGRNFQFAHHLVLFDLPMNPDLLEQRIGRLDRIGQTEDVQIHVPYLKDSAQDVLFHWYHQGLNAFEASFAGSGAVLEQFGSTLEALLDGQEQSDLSAHLAEVSDYCDQLRADLQNGRDKLLELNSSNPVIAANLIEQIEAQDESEALAQYVTMACDTMGIEPDYHSEASLVLKPSEHGYTHAIPGLGDEGLTVTFNRRKALVREDMEFLTWESPIVAGLMEAVIESETGNSTIGTISLKALSPGTLLAECYFVMQVQAPRKYQLERFLPFTPIRVLLDSAGRNLSAPVSHDALNQLCRPIKKHARTAIIKEIRTPLAALLDESSSFAEREEQQLKDAAKDNVARILGHETERLRQLQTINPSVRSEEIDFFKTQHEEVLKHIDQARLTAQAIRVVIAT